MTDPVRRRLVIIGLGSLPVYGLVALLSASFQYGERYRERPFLAMLGLLALAWVGYALALAGVLGRRRPFGVDAERAEAADRRMPMVLAFATAFRLILLFSRPIQEIDYYRYLGDGRVVLHGLNPFRHAPAEIDRLGPGSEPDSPPGRRWRLACTSVPVRTIFERVHHRQVPTIYPPAFQAVFALSALLTPPSAPIGVHVLVLKCLLVAFDLGTLLVLARLLRRLGLPEDWCLAYGWCPLVLKEFANSAHLDAIAVFLTVLAADYLAGTPDRPTGRRGLREPVLGAISLGLAVLAKGYPVVLLPTVAAFLIARLRARAIIPALAFASVVLAGYVPFLAGAPRQGEGSAHSPWTGLGTFLTRWEKNDLLFMLAHENLGPPAPGVPGRWFVLVPGGSATGDRSRRVRPAGPVPRLRGRRAGVPAHAGHDGHGHRDDLHRLGRARLQDSDAPGPAPRHGPHSVVELAPEQHAPPLVPDLERSVSRLRGAEELVPAPGACPDVLPSLPHGIPGSARRPGRHRRRFRGIRLRGRLAGVRTVPGGTRRGDLVRP